MSWNGFMKAVNRATTSVMISAGAIEKTVDKEYKREEERFKNLEAKIERLFRESKGFLDSVRIMSLAQKQVAELIDQFYPEGAKMGYAAVQYKDVVTRLDEDTRLHLDECYRTTVLDPLGKFVAVFPEFEDVMKKRDRKLLDYDRSRGAVSKQANKPDEDPNKYSRSQQEALQAKQVYEDFNKKLLKEIPQLIDARVLYLEPILEALIKNMWTYYRESHTKFEGVKKGFEYGGKQANGYGLEGQAELVLQQMRQLSISQPIHQ